LDRLYAQIKQEKGKLDTIFANAGGGNFLPLGAITEEHYHETFDTNVKGVIFTVQKALPLRLRDSRLCHVMMNSLSAAWRAVQVHRNVFTTSAQEVASPRVHQLNPRKYRLKR
jgi:NAD(P)-dependent dehydrogenase (short-subunit alcohol dehydrogenase family)